MIRLQIRLPPYFALLVDKLVADSGLSKTATVEHLLRQFELLAKNNKLPEAVGLDVLEAVALLNAQGHGAKHLDPVDLHGGGALRYDIKLFEVSRKTKTGFEGVHATTSGKFRALVPDVMNGGGSKYLPVRGDGASAAQDRYEWFEKHGLPYGNIGVHIEAARKRHPNKTDEQLLVELRDFMSNMNPASFKNPVTVEEIERTLARYREAHGIVVPMEIEPSPISSGRPATVMCVHCNLEIGDGQPFKQRTKDRWAHRSCADAVDDADDAAAAAAAGLDN